MTAAPSSAEAMENRERRGDWGLTVTGRQFWPADPRLGDVVIEDIAHSLAHQCRFAGHTREFYSVAQHSVLVSRLCSPANRLAGLLHDSTEAYTQDIIKPLKRQLAGYKELEDAWAVCIGLTFGVELLDLAPEIHRADLLALVAERRDLMAEHASWKSLPGDVFRARCVERIDPWLPEKAEREFLFAWRKLRGPL